MFQQRSWISSASEQYVNITNKLQELQIFMKLNVLEPHDLDCQLAGSLRDG